MSEPEVLWTKIYTPGSELLSAGLKTRDWQTQNVWLKDAHNTPKEVAVPLFEHVDSDGNILYFDAVQEVKIIEWGGIVYNHICMYLRDAENIPVIESLHP